jgi:hypothetical protein
MLMLFTLSTLWMARRSISVEIAEMRAAVISQKASSKSEMPLFATLKMPVRHHMKYLVSVAAATGLLNTSLADILRNFEMTLKQQRKP